MPPTPPFHFLADIRKFRHASTRYYGENALVLAECSRLAYENRFIIREKLLRNWRFKNVRYFSHQGSQAFLAANNQFMIAAFRGTEPRRLRDWSTDSKVRLVPGP
ncbi:MAG TPA: hypothetical protein VIU33_07390, partial [Nitrospiria bacterium]